MDQRLPSFLLAAILIVLLVSAFQGPAVTTTPGAADQRPAQLGDPDLRPRVEAIETRLAALEEAVRTRGASVASAAFEPSAQGGERQPVPASEVDVQSLRAEMANLQRAVAPLPQSDSRSNGAALVRAGEYPRNQEEIDRFAQFSSQDHEAARESIILLNATDVLARFGKPHYVQLGQNGAMIWRYRHSREREPGVGITFVNGIVISD